MLIGGRDIVFACRRPHTAMQLVIRLIQATWPLAVVEEAADEAFIYKTDADRHNKAIDHRLVHVLVGDRSVTIVVTHQEHAETEQLVSDLRRCYYTNWALLAA